MPIQAEDILELDLVVKTFAQLFWLHSSVLAQKIALFTFHSAN